MRHDEVLAAGLADEAGVGVVAGDVGAHLAPQVLEHPGRTGEVDAGQAAVGEHHVGHLRPGAVHEVDDARGQSGGFEQLHRRVGGDGLGLRGLPHHGVAHQRRRGRQVAGDGGEVERGDRVDESLERAVFEPVPHTGRGDRLLGDDLTGEVHVEPPEVDQLAGGVDLGLIGGLGLAEHGGGGEGFAPWPGQQVGGAQEHCGPVLEGERAPGGRGGVRGGDGVGDVGRGGIGQGAENRGVAVRLHHVDRRAGAAAVRATDDVMDLRRRRGELGQLGLQTGALGGARRERSDRLVDRLRRDGDGVHVTSGVVARAVTSVNPIWPPRYSSDRTNSRSILVRLDDMATSLRDLLVALDTAVAELVSAPAGDGVEVETVALLDRSDLAVDPESPMAQLYLHVGTRR